MRRFILPLTAAAALIAAVPAAGQNAKPLCRTIDLSTGTLPARMRLLRPPMKAKLAFKLDLQTVSWDDISPESLATPLMAGWRPPT